MQKKIRELTDHPFFPWVLCIAVFAAKVGFVNYRSIWLDESFSIFQAQRPVHEIWKSFFYGGPNPPVFEFILHFWVQLGGIGVGWVRVVPLLCHALTVAFLFKTAKLVSGTAAAWLAVFLFVFSFEHFYFAFEIRTYALVCLGTAISLYLFIALKSAFDLKKMVLFFCVNLMLVFSHYFTWFVVLNEFAFLFFVIRSRKVRYYMLGSFVLLLLCYIPVVASLYRQFKGAAETNWRNPPYPGQYINEIRMFLNTDTVYKLILYLMLAGSLLKLRECWKKRTAMLTDAGLKYALFFFLWFIVPYSLLYAVAFRVPMFIERYLLFSTIGLYLFIATFIAYLYNRYRIIKVAVVLVIGICSFKEMKIRHNGFYERDLEKAVAYVKGLVKPGTTIILYPYWTDTEFAYYYDKKIFKDPEHFTANLNAHAIYPVWHAGMGKEAFEKDNLNTQVLLFLDCGAEDPPESVNIQEYLQQHARLTDSATFSNTFKIRYYSKAAL